MSKSNCVRVNKVVVVVTGDLISATETGWGVVVGLHVWFRVRFLARSLNSLFSKRKIEKLGVNK